MIVNYGLFFYLPTLLNSLMNLLVKLSDKFIKTLLLHTFFLKVNTPAISVILPFFNAVQTLKNAMKSIQHQSFGDFECILVNNNSTDGAAEIARQWVKNDKRFILVEEKKQGVVHAFSKGLSYARAKYIARMDSDDQCLTQRFSVQHQWLENNPEVVAVGGKVILVTENTSDESFRRYIEWSNSLTTPADIEKQQFIELPVVNPTLMWRREVGEKYGCYREGSFPEDYEMVLRWLSQGLKIHKLNQNVLRWFDHENRLTRTDERYSQNAFFRIKTLYLAQWLNKVKASEKEILIWGASKKSRHYAAMLPNYNIHFSGYIDIKETRQLSLPVIHFEDLPSPGRYFILVYVFHPAQRKQINAYLLEKGYAEGESFLHM